MKTSFKHTNIKNSKSRIWKKSFLNKVCKECSLAGYDVVKTPDSITIGIKETDQIFLQSMRGTSAWLTRYDSRIFS